MENLEIKKEKVLQIYDKTDKKDLKKDVMHRIKTVDDILSDNGITKEDFDNDCQKMTNDEKAYKIIKLLCNSLNEGWVPNWDNSNEYKYYPWFNMCKGSSGFRCHDDGLWVTHSSVGSRLCFKSSKLAEYAGTQFTDIYKDFMIIN